MAFWRDVYFLPKAFRQPKVSGRIWQVRFVRGGTVATWRGERSSRVIPARRAAFEVLLVLALVPGCVNERCYANQDCPHPKVCSPEGRCVFKCVVAADCGAGFDCIDHQCQPVIPGSDTGTDIGDDAVQPQPQCPDDMVLVARTYCLDLYEASRPDATEDFEGLDGAKALSRKGVIPWMVDDTATAEAACQAAGKRLCTPAEWEFACRGPDGTEYPYGDSYVAETCNGIDAFGKGKFRLAPTGSFPECTNEVGAFDLSGNLWEHVAGGDGRSVRGGAFNCIDSAALHRCGYIPGNWVPSALGFRCCAAPTYPDGTPEAADEPFLPDLPVAEDVVEPADAPQDGSEEGGGCLDPDVPEDLSGDLPADLPRELPLDEAADADPGPADPGHDDSGVFDPWPVDPGPVDPGPDDPGPDDPGHDDPGGPSRCPADMVLVAPYGVAAWCLDRYEASRSDATATGYGSSTMPSSRPGVLPWMSVTLAVARTACESAGKRLCTTSEWKASCTGPDYTVYSYGNLYVADTCNGIDTFCDCEGKCASVAFCPYPHCRVQASPSGDGGPCGAYFHVLPTGSFPGCTNEWGAFDLNGNVWELVEAGDGVEHFRGGAYNCSDSELLHRCDYDATWNPSAKGFRCCADAGPP